MPIRLVTFDEWPEPEQTEPAADRRLRGDPRQQIWNLYGVAGDSFVVPAEFEGTWEVLEPAVKLYAIFEPGAT
jgi:uncharacterized cupin superfamily protein